MGKLEREFLWPKYALRHTVMGTTVDFLHTHFYTPRCARQLSAQLWMKFSESFVGFELVAGSFLGEMVEGSLGVIVGHFDV